MSSIVPGIFFLKKRLCLNVCLEQSSANFKIKRLNRPLVVSLRICPDPPDELTSSICFGICLVLWEEIVLESTALWKLQHVYIS